MNPLLKVPSREEILLASGFCMGLSTTPGRPLAAQDREILLLAGQVLELYVKRWPLIVHHLHAGVTPCNMAGVPKDWPGGHLWDGDWKLVNCEGCLSHRPTEAKP